MKHTAIPLFLSIILLAGCTVGLPYSFEDTLPSGSVLSDHYTVYKTPPTGRSELRFQMMVPNGWEITSTPSSVLPSSGAMLSLAVMREPKGLSGAAYGEIDVDAFDAKGVTDTPVQWFIARLSKKATDKYTVLARRERPAPEGPVADLLLTSTGADGLLVMRMKVLRKNNTMFLITCSDQSAHYEKNAEACATALLSFRLAAKEEDR